jgi:hypothetical protein
MIVVAISSRGCRPTLIAKFSALMPNESNPIGWNTTRPRRRWNLPQTSAPEYVRAWPMCSPSADG